MGPNNNRNQWTAAEKKKIPLLPRYLCRDCKKWKDTSLFSKREQGDYQWKKAQVPSTNAESAKLRCSNCSGAQVHELTCQGQCGQVKPLDDFSKAQRTRGEGWCKECVQWKEAAEPGLVTAAAPNTDLAPDEIEGVRIVEPTKFKLNKKWHSSSKWDPEMGDESGDDDYDDDAYGADEDSGADEDQGFTVPYRAFGMMTLMDTSNTATSVATPSGSNVPSIITQSNQSTTALARHHPTASATSSSQNGYIPPHLRTAETTSAGSRAGYLPPHLRSSTDDSQSINGDASDLRSESSVSNIYETSSTVGTQSRVGWSAVDARRRNGLPINPPSQTPAQQRLPSSQTTTPSQASFTPPPRALQVPLAQPQDRGTGNWARAVGQRRAPPQFPAHRVVQARNVYESDESQDEM